MKLIIFLFAFISTAQAQTYTTAQLSGYLRTQWKTNDSLRKANAALVAKAEVKDANDDKRNVLIDSLFRENKRLKERVDSAGIYYNGNDFDIDSNKKLSIKPKEDTFIIIRKEKPDLGIRLDDVDPWFARGASVMDGSITLDTTIHYTGVFGGPFPTFYTPQLEDAWIDRGNGGTFWQKEHSTVAPEIIHPILNVQDIATGSNASVGTAIESVIINEKEIANLKEQIQMFEKMLDDDKKVIDKLQNIIDKQQAQIAKLTKKKN